MNTSLAAIDETTLSDRGRELLDGLNPQQRERATELMYQADEIDAQVRAEEADKQKMIASRGPTETPSLFITSIIYPGVKIIFGNKMTVFRKERKGPIKVERRVVNRVEEICIVDRSSGSVTTMPTYDYVPDTPDEKP